MNRLIRSRVMKEQGPKLLVILLVAVLLIFAYIWDQESDPTIFEVDVQSATAGVVEVGDIVIIPGYYGSDEMLDPIRAQCPEALWGQIGVVYTTNEFLTTIRTPAGFCYNTETARILILGDLFDPPEFTEAEITDFPTDEPVP